LNLNYIDLITTSAASQFKQSLIFSLTIGLIPSLYLVVGKCVKINSIHQASIILSIIIVTGIMFWHFTIEQCI